MGEKGHFAGESHEQQLQHHQRQYLGPRTNNRSMINTMQNVDIKAKEKDLPQKKKARMFEMAMVAMESLASCSQVPNN